MTDTPKSNTYPYRFGAMPSDELERRKMQDLQHRRHVCSHVCTIAVICGSTKNRKQMTELNKKLTLDGKIVLAPGVFAHDGDEITDEQKTKLDDLHLEKIDLADEVHVVVVGGYIGLSTSAEIEYAKKTGKPITFHHDISIT